MLQYLEILNKTSVPQEIGQIHKKCLSLTLLIYPKENLLTDHILLFDIIF